MVPWPEQAVVPIEETLFRVGIVLGERPARLERDQEAVRRTFRH
jgi:hypothetical protein